MAAPVLRQACHNTCARYQQRTLTATFSAPTLEKSLIVVTAACGGSGATTVTGPAGFTLIRNVIEGRLQLVVWYREGAPATSSLTVSVADHRSIQIRAVEYTGAAQTGSLDKVTVRTDDDDRPSTGVSAATAQADTIVIAAIANSRASCSQSGFGGGLTRLYETLSPQYWGSSGRDDDDNRTRLTHHHLIANAVSLFTLSAYLSSYREWVAILCTFKGGTYGPKQLVSKLGGQVTSSAGTGVLSAFGPLRSGVLMSTAPALDNPTGTGRMLPFEYQYRLNGLLLSGVVDTTSLYQVLSNDGLYGMGVRTSDSDQPRGDGALRGIDLQSARQILFEVLINDTPDGIERQLDALYRTLVPRRDTDWDLIWRHPGQVARMIRVRPTDLPRQVDHDGTIRAKQAFTLRAADPRHYSAVAKQVTVPVTAAGALYPNSINVTNLGNTPAHPLITITGPSSGPAVSRIELVNATSLVTFDVQLTLQKGSALVGDMDARITGAPRSAITLDGVSKYGSWQLPRAPFRLDADPTGQAGFNVLYLKTTPAGAPVTCTLDYRDVWSG